MFYNSKYGNLSKALINADSVAVLGVLLKVLYTFTTVKLIRFIVDWRYSFVCRQVPITPNLMGGSAS